MILDSEEIVTGTEEFVSKYALLSAERKMLQSNSDLPSWVITPGYQMLKSKYLDEGETLKERFSTIAKTASKYMPDPEYWETTFFDLMWEGRLALSTPILSSMGKDKGCPVSCASGGIEDSVYGFYSSQLEAAILSKNGFGTSSYLGDIRPRGSTISGSREVASGVLPVLKDFIQVASDINQGSRRGAWAGYLPIDHDDFYEVYNHIHKYPDGANIGWCITDSFISRLNEGDVEAIGRYQDIIKMRMTSGKGYLWFPDKVNRVLPPWYREKNLKNKGSNLCVAPETMILTDNGYIDIGSLENESVNVWNGEEFSKTKVVKTGENVKVITVALDTGEYLTCTPYHKFYVAEGYTGRRKEIRAIDLQEGDKLIKYELPPAISGTKILKYAYENGFYSGDGWFDKASGKDGIYLYHGKRCLKPYFFNEELKWREDNIRNRSSILTRGLLKPKFFVPTSEYTLKSRVDWLAGYLDADGTVVYSEGDGAALLQIGSIEPEFLRELQLMLQELGIKSKVCFAIKAGEYLMPDNKGNGNIAYYNCKKAERLLISCGETLKLKNLGLNTHRLKLTDYIPQRDAQRFSKVVSVVDNNRYSDTFCFTEPLRNMGMFNGILAGNCNETVPVLQGDDETYSCILSSANAIHSDTWREDETIFNSFIFLHCVALNFIDIGQDIPGLEKVVNYTRNHMSIGLGILGFHTLLQQKGVPFESLDAHLHSNELSKFMSDETLRASRYLADIFGEAPICEGWGVANALRMNIAPNLSSALICGGISQGIEPIYKNVYIQHTSAGKVTRVNPELLKVMRTKDINIETELDKILDNSGSVKDVEWLTGYEKQVFKTAFEIDQRVILRLASQRQRYIDQGQSINLFFSADEDEGYISEVHKEAILDPNIKGLYYVRSETGIQVSKNECVACEG